jgi:hypothetical protein
VLASREPRPGISASVSAKRSKRRTCPLNTISRMAFSKMMAQQITDASTSRSITPFTIGSALSTIS